MLNITELSAKLARIDLRPEGLTGFEHFITSYVYRDEDNTFLIDIGPAATAPDLLLALKKLNVARVDYILLTHIHLDHAGAAGHLAQALPHAKIICHANGVKHLHQPQKLWQSSLGVLKNFALAYREPRPAPLQNLLAANKAAIKGLEIIETPGHAPHHLSFAFNDCLFIGEAAGVFFNFGPAEYLRPATPPRFVMEQAVNSLKTLEKLTPKLTAFAHYGVSANGPALIAAAQTQLKHWAATAKRVIIEADGGMDECIDELLQTDPLVLNFNMFNAVEQKRERGFFANALLGICGWLKEAAAGM